MRSAHNLQFGSHSVQKRQAQRSHFLSVYSNGGLQRNVVKSVYCAGKIRGAIYTSYDNNTLLLMMTQKNMQQLAGY
jgi:hypothetical protein